METKETDKKVDEFKDQLHKITRDAKGKPEEINAAIGMIFDAFTPKETTDISINGRPAKLILTKKNHVNIMFTDADDGEAYYRSQVNFYK